MNKEVFIVSACRTPIGSFGGSLKGVSTVELGSIAIREALVRAQADPADVDEVFIGCVLQAGLKQNVARQAAIKAGLPVEAPCVTVNMVCGSGQKAVIQASKAAQVGDGSLFVAGGAENMSDSPHVLFGMRWGTKMGNATLIDTMTTEGLSDAFSGEAMGITAENVAKRYNISRERQDAFSVESQRKAVEALKNGSFAEEIIPVPVPQKKGDPVLFATDEYPRPDSNIEKLGKLKPAFIKDGTVTAGNSSGINDGAAAVIVASEEGLKKTGAAPLARIVSYACAGVDPDYMGIGPVPALSKALAKAGLSVSDIDIYELNEAFASQSLAVADELCIPEDRINVKGGAIALGHPIGASGTRILVTLLYTLKRLKKRYGACALCVGGGMGVAMVVENLMGGTR